LSFTASAKCVGVICYRAEEEEEEEEEEEKEEEHFMSEHPNDTWGNFEMVFWDQSTDRFKLQLLSCRRVLNNNATSVPEPRRCPTGWCLRN
jgi:hypothetical protein